MLGAIFKTEQFSYLLCRRKRMNEDHSTYSSTYDAFAVLYARQHFFPNDVSISATRLQQTDHMYTRLQNCAFPAFLWRF